MMPPRSLRVLADISCSERPGPAFKEGISLPISCEEWFAIQRFLDSAPSEIEPPLNVDKMIVDELSELLNEPPAHLVSTIEEWKDQRASAGAVSDASGINGAHAQSEAHPPAPLALGTPRTDALLKDMVPEATHWAITDLARTLERELAESRLNEADAWMAQSHAATELAAATERLNAPVPEIESQAVTFRDANGQFVPADLARDLGRRLANEQGKWNGLYKMLQSAEQRAEAAERQLAEAVAKERWPKRTSCMRCGADWNNGQLDPEEYDRKVGIEAAAEVAEQEKLVRAALSGWLK